MNLIIVNKALVRILVVSLIIFMGALYQIYATDISGINGGMTISGNLYVTSTMTVSGNEASPASHSLIFWDGANCPTGWTDVSASYSGRFPIGSTVVSTGGSASHIHYASHAHSLTGASVSSVAHTHTVGGSDDTQSHSHTQSGCGVTDGQSAFGGCYGLSGGSTDTANHNHNGYVSYTMDAADSHSHSVASYSGDANQNSGSGDLTPAYKTLKLCKKW